MSTWYITVYLTECFVADPHQNKSMRDLRARGFHNVESVETQRRIDFQLEAESLEAATAQATDLCEQLLANPVLETYRLEVNNTQPIYLVRSGGLKPQGAS